MAQIPRTETRDDPQRGIRPPAEVEIARTMDTFLEAGVIR